MPLILIKEKEWPEITAALRKLVVDAGYPDWDLHAFAALSLSEQRSDRDQCLAYLGWFIDYQRILTRESLDGLSKSLGELLHDSDGNPVSSWAIYTSDTAESEKDVAKRHRIEPSAGATPDEFVANLKTIHSQLRQGAVYVPGPDDDDEDLG